MISTPDANPNANTADAQHANFTAYVHLAYGFDALKWQKNWHNGKLLGLNEEFPYGYQYATKFGASVIHSKDYPEGRFQKLVRYGFRWLSGFDGFHAWYNRDEILNADVVWTHTESQSLAILFLFLISNRPAPKIIAQMVWLMDEWPRLGPLKRALYKKLLRKADILTFLSPLNTREASRIFPGKRTEFVKFGINTDYAAPQSARTEKTKIRVLSVGNDRHRDWQTLIDAVSGTDDIEVRLVTTTYKLNSEYDNISVVKVNLNPDLLALYEWADMLVLPLKPNLHASGITVVEEAVILGVPVICSNVGGMESYFTGQEVLYVDPSDAKQIQTAIRRLAADAQLQKDLVANSKRRLVEGGLDSKSFVKRHVELSRELLQKPGIA
jgi:glycosyltransferase involved in cell wall biosynthesis